MDNWEKEMLDKIDSDTKLTAREVRSLVFEADEEETIEGENRRWYRTNETIVKLGDRYFSILWEQGLTEYQENEFDNQPVEVEKKVVTRTITENIWTPIDRQLSPSKEDYE